MYPADRTVLSKPALAGCAMDHPASRRALRPGYPLEDHRTQAAPNQISGGGGVHSPHSPSGPAATPQPPAGKAERQQQKTGDQWSDSYLNES